MTDLSGRTVLLTGASKGIGAATAEAMIAAGARLIAHYGSDQKGAEAATAKATEGQVTLVQADLSKPDGVSNLYSATREALGRQPCGDPAEN